MVFLGFLNTERAADHARETFKWHLRGVARPPQLLLEKYRDLCLYFNLAVAEEATQDFCIPNMIHVVFYAMVINIALELGVLSKDLVEHLTSSLEGLCWYMCEAWPQLDKHALLWAQYRF